MNGGRPAGENDPDGPLVPNLFQRNIPGDNFRINMTFADTAGDELGILAAEVEDEDFLSF
jgi:hypothetical protein